MHYSATWRRECWAVRGDVVAGSCDELEELDPRLHLSIPTSMVAAGGVLTRTVRMLLVRSKGTS